MKTKLKKMEMICDLCCGGIIPTIGACRLYRLGFEVYLATHSEDIKVRAEAYRISNHVNSSDTPCMNLGWQAANRAISLASVENHGAENKE